MWNPRGSDSYLLCFTTIMRQAKPYPTGNKTKIEKGDELHAYKSDDVLQIF